MFSCKKETKEVENQTIEGFYNVNGFEYITTIKKNNGIITPFFIGKVKDENKLKIVYSEKINTSNIFKSFILEDGRTKEWTVNSDEKYYSYSKPFLSLDGSFISNGEYFEEVENTENQFLYIDKSKGPFDLKLILKFDNKIIGRKSIHDGSEIINYNSGNGYKILNLKYNNDINLNFTSGKMFSEKMWNFAISEYTNSDLAFAYTKGNKLYFSLLNSEFDRMIIDSLTLKNGYNYYASGCDYGVYVGSEIKIIQNKENPYFTVGGREGKANNFSIFQLLNNKIIQIDSNVRYKELFAYNNSLYGFYDNILEKFDGKLWQKISLPSSITILNLFGSNEGVFLATRKKDDKNLDYFDIVRLNYL